MSTLPSINVQWLYPNVLDLHGGRGDVMGLRHAAGLLGVDCEIRRLDDAAALPDLDWADLLWLGPGEVRCAAALAGRLAACHPALAEFAAAGGMIVAVGSSGAILARETARADGSSFPGLGLLDAVCRESGAVHGDDLWFALDDGEEVMGVQISLLDTLLDVDSPTKPLGRVIYGRGNDGDSRQEGARRGNVVFTNALGPVCVKNPRFAARLLAEAARAKGLQLDPALAASQTEIEDASFALIRRFIENKRHA